MAIPLLWITQPNETLAALIIIFGVIPPAVLNYMLAETYGLEPQRVTATVAVDHVIALMATPLTLTFAL